MTTHAQRKPRSGVQPIFEIMPARIVLARIIEISARTIGQTVDIRAHDIRYSRHVVVTGQAESYRVRCLQQFLRRNIGLGKSAVRVRRGLSVMGMLGTGVHDMTMRTHKRTAVVEGRDGIYVLPDIRHGLPTRVNVAATIVKRPVVSGQSRMRKQKNKETDHKCRKLKKMFHE